MFFLLVSKLVPLFESVFLLGVGHSETVKSGAENDHILEVVADGCPVDARISNNLYAICAILHRVPVRYSFFVYNVDDLARYLQACSELC